MGFFIHDKAVFLLHISFWVKKDMSWLPPPKVQNLRKKKVMHLYRIVASQTVMSRHAGG